MKKRKNKKGWIRIVEAVIALLLITGVVLTLISQGYLFKEDISEKVYSVQISVLREIEKDSDLRQQILNSEENSVPGDVVNRINERMPNYLECSSKICDLDLICSLTSSPDTDVYAQSVAITATSSTYDPKQLKMFCWVK
jgi:hypothetical protein